MYTMSNCQQEISFSVIISFCYCCWQRVISPSVLLINIFFSCFLISKHSRSPSRMNWNGLICWFPNLGLRRFEKQGQNVLTILTPVLLLGALGFHCRGLLFTAGKMFGAHSPFRGLNCVILKIYMLKF